MYVIWKNNLQNFSYMLQLKTFFYFTYKFVKLLNNNMQIYESRTLIIIDDVKITIII